MSVEACVDRVHHRSEIRTVGRGITAVTDSQRKMNHLVQDGVLQFLLRKVKSGGETQHVVPMRPAHPVAFAPCLKLSDKGASTRKHETRGGKFAFKHQFVEALKTISDEWKRELHDLLLLPADIGSILEDSKSALTVF